MTSTAFVSANGAPGVTTAACAIGAVWPAEREVVLVECDPAGGDLAARFGIPIEPGLTSWVLDQRASESQPDGILSHAQVLPGGLKVVVGPVGADTSVALDRELGSVDSDGSWVRHLGEVTDLILDAGRYNPQSSGQQQILRCSDNVVIVSRCDASAVAHGKWLVDTLSALRSRPSRAACLLVVGDGPFSPDECAQALGCALVGTLPMEREAASMLSGEPGRSRALARSSLVRIARRVASQLAVAPLSEELSRVG